MRLALVGPTHPYKGGVAQHTTRLAHELSARGHEVELVSWSSQYPALLYPGQQRVDEPEQPVFPRTTYPLSWRRPLGWWRTGRRLRREVDAVVLVVVTPVQAPAHVTLARGLGRGVRTVALCHNVLPHERRGVDETLVRGVLSRVDSVLVHADAEAETARRLTDAEVAVSPLPPPHTFGEGHRSAVGRPVTRTVVFFGMVRPYKGLDVLLRALPEAPGVRLVVAGEFWGGSEPTRALVAELGLGDRVELREGYLPAEQVPALLEGADALVLPYRSSTASWNASLGHEHGLPVVATTVGTMAEQVRDGVDGLLCPPEDPAALAALLRRLYEPGVLEELRANVGPTAGDGQWAAYVETVERLTGSSRP
ncbi:MAG: glycosyltransferase family 4 protein [Nocardioidaceae bacterium]